MEQRHPVLAAFDGSAASRHALAYAAGLARRQDRWLVVVHVSRLGGLAPLELTRRAAAERLGWLRRELAGEDLTGLDIELIECAGDPARELCRVTAERAADVIVLGTSRGRGRGRGSVPAWLARRTPCPAVVVP